MRGQAGSFGIDERRKDLSAKGDDLGRLKGLVDFEMFRPAPRRAVPRSDTAKGFMVLPKRWLVERAIAGLNRRRRLAKDWECLTRKALAFLHLASIRLISRKLRQTSP